MMQEVLLWLLYKVVQLQIFLLTSNCLALFGFLTSLLRQEPLQGPRQRWGVMREVSLPQGCDLSRVSLHYNAEAPRRTKSHSAGVFLRARIPDSCVSSVGSLLTVETQPGCFAQFLSSCYSFVTKCGFAGKHWTSHQPRESDSIYAGKQIHQ